MKSHSRVHILRAVLFPAGVLLVLSLLSACSLLSDDIEEPCNPKVQLCVVAELDMSTAPTSKDMRLELDMNMVDPQEMGVDLLEMESDMSKDADMTASTTKDMAVALGFEACARQPLPGGWTSLDIGNASLTGLAGESNGRFCLIGSGEDIFFKEDAFRFVWKEVRGNVQITAKVSSLVGSEAYTKAGVMIRSSLDRSASHAMVNTTSSEGHFLTYRTQEKELTQSVPIGVGEAPAWVRLTRWGNRMIGEYSDDGVTFERLSETVVLGLRDKVYVGLALTSHDDQSRARAEFEEVSIKPWDPPTTCVTPKGKLYDSFKTLADEIQDGEVAVLRGGTTKLDAPLSINKRDIKISVECGATHTVDGEGVPSSSAPFVKFSGQNITLDGSPGKLIFEKAPSRGVLLINTPTFHIKGVTTRLHKLAGLQLFENVRHGLIEDVESYGSYGERTDGQNTEDRADGFQLLVNRTAPRERWPRRITFRRVSAHHNASDGFDFPHGNHITVENSVAYANGCDINGNTYPSQYLGAGIKLSYAQKAYYDKQGGPDAPNGHLLRNSAFWGNADNGILIGSGENHRVEGVVVFDNVRKNPDAREEIGTWEVEDALIENSTYTKEVRNTSNITRRNNTIKPKDEFGVDVELNANQSPKNPNTFLGALAPWISALFGVL